jgi:hypothetical protein
MRHKYLIIILSTLLVSLISAAAALGEALLLSSDQLYALAAFQGENEEALVADLKDTNPDSSINKVTRNGSALRLHFRNGDYLEILTNELYSLASYVPPGIDKEISRRSSPSIRISGIERDGAGVIFKLAGSLPGSRSAARQGRPASPASYEEEKKAETQEPEKTGSPEPVPVTAPEPEEVKPAAKPEPEPEEKAVEKKEAPKEEPAKKETPEKQPVKKAAKKEPVKKKAPVKKKPVKKAPPKKKPVKKAPPKKKPVKKEPPGKAPAKKADKIKPAEGEVIVSTASGLLPVVDGSGDDRAWKDAITTTFPVKGFKGDIAVSALEGAGQLFLRFIWSDRNPAKDHRRWYWDADGKRYRRSKELDDGLAVRWLMEGKATPDLRSGDAGVFDAWIWRSGREGLGSYASDARVLVSDSPIQLARYFTTAEGKGIWLKQEYDKGRLPFEVVIPPAFTEEKVNSFTSQSPMGSASDVQARGQWKDGVWTLEYSRKLDTGNQDDMVFSKGRSVSFVVSILERKELDAAPYSQVMTLNWK